MVCFKEIKFEYRGGFANNFGRMKIKSVVIIPAMFSNGGFVGFLISNTEFMFLLLTLGSSDKLYIKAEFFISLSTEQIMFNAIPKLQFAIFLTFISTLNVVHSPVK